MEMVRGFRDLNTSCLLMGVHFRVVEPGWTFELEHHHMFELVSCRSGEFRIDIGTRTLSLSAGDWCLIKSGKRHMTANASDAHSSLLVIHFDVDSPKLRKLLQSDSLDYIPAARTYGTRFSEFVDQFDKLLYRSVVNGDTVQRYLSVGAEESLLVQGHFMLMLYELLQWIRANAKEEAGDSTMTSTYHLDLAQQAAVMLTERTGSASIGDIAKQLGVSRIHLSRVFAKVFGMPPQQYVASCRMKRARMLLTMTHLSLKEIAEQLGYSNAGHFNTQYRRWFGVSPGKARPKVLRASEDHEAGDK